MDDVTSTTVLCFYTVGQSTLGRFGSGPRQPDADVETLLPRDARLPARHGQDSGTGDKVSHRQHGSWVSTYFLSNGYFPPQKWTDMKCSTSATMAHIFGVVADGFSQRPGALDCSRNGATLKC